MGSYTDQRIEWLMNGGEKPPKPPKPPAIVGIDAPAWSSQPHSKDIIATRFCTYAKADLTDHSPRCTAPIQADLDKCDKGKSLNACCGPCKFQYECYYKNDINKIKTCDKYTISIKQVVRRFHPDGNILSTRTGFFCDIEAPDHPDSGRYTELDLLLKHIKRYHWKSEFVDEDEDDGDISNNAHGDSAMSALDTRADGNGDSDDDVDGDKARRGPGRLLKKISRVF